MGKLNSLEFLLSGKLICLCALLPFLESCRKDSGPCENLSGQNYPTELTIGDLSAVVLWELNVTLQGKYHNEKFYYLNMDVDNDSDFVVSHYVSDGGGGGGASFNGVSIQNISSDSYFRFQQVDTLYTYTDTFYYALDPVNAVIVTHTNCYDAGNPGTVMHVEENLSFAQPGDMIYSTEVWKNKGWHALHAPTYYVSETTSEWYSTGNDTLWSIVIDSARSCEIIPLNSLTYIPVKTTTCGLERMGWVKLEMGPNTEVVYIRELAIQK